MSTVSANLNASGQVVANDVYRYLFNKRATERQLIRAGRVVMALICILAVIVAWKVQTIIRVAIFMLGLSSAELSANWAQWWWWRFNKSGRLAATFGGPLIFLAAQFFWSNMMKVGNMFTLGYLATLTGMAATTAVWVAVTLLTRPDDMEILKEFYRRAKPLGFWGPVRRAVGDEMDSRSRGRILQGFFLSLAGFSAVVFLILGLSNFYLGKFRLGIALLAGFTGLGVVFLVLFNRYFRSISSEGVK
jgi:hypothetical protein